MTHDVLVSCVKNVGSSVHKILTKKVNGQNDGMRQRTK